MACIGLSATTFAETSGPIARANATQVQRPLSEDPLIDQNLVAPLADPAPAAVAVVASAPEQAPAAAVVAAASRAHGIDTDQQMAAIGPAMRSLVPEFNAIWPTTGEITTYFGERGPLSPHGHSGLDIAGPQGTPILAADDGEVLKAFWNDEGYGGLVIIGHPSGYETWYGHLLRFDVEKGEKVKRGQKIALRGSTGYSTGAHLHFEVRQDGQLCDPLTFLKEANLKPAST